jgi:hypothetical protein
MAYRLLISSPSDIAGDDLAAVNEAINRWNVIYGQQFGAVVVPVHWQLHSAAEHGIRPQASLNAQLVENVDIVVALFWHRLGSPTGGEESGTAEEISKAHADGAYVAILKCGRDLPPNVNVEQLRRLRAFYEQMSDKSFMHSYVDVVSLTAHVDAILGRAVGRDSGRAEVVAGTAQLGSDVWPRIESSEHPKTDSRGRLKTNRRWHLVLANRGAEPARNVRYRLEAEDESDNLPLQPDEEPNLETLAPGGEAAYALLMHVGVGPQARCVVTWEDSFGEHENQATVRFF